ncbi:hypothetical protein J1N35_023572 [Gossypium stocksii]|uniref:HTH myb-type domain-containing protein n=1 Tax=Gossypium stocksii TaxID=47602 RepID=A0A9D4A278_9ROSI|nr:hypothetical protein J1N35_023572 [Gossypium stocksii]
MECCAKEHRVGTCGKSCRLRWANHLRPDLKKGSFSPEEERIIIELHAKMGNKWARMASQAYKILRQKTAIGFGKYIFFQFCSFTLWNTRVNRWQRHGLPLYAPDVQPLYPQHHQRHSHPPSPMPLHSLHIPHRPLPQNFLYNPHSALTTPPPLPSPYASTPPISPHFTLPIVHLLSQISLSSIIPTSPPATTSSIATSGSSMTDFKATVTITIILMLPARALRCQCSNIRIE